MARDHARVNLALWRDPDFRALPPMPQYLYLALWTSAGLTYCGTHDWRPARLSGLAHGMTAEHVETFAACLAARHFLVIDPETEEVLVRSWMRFDGLLKQPRMAISAITAYGDVGSQVLRKVLVHEFAKIKNESPDMACWKDKRVQEVLSHPSISAKDLPPVSDPFGDGFGGDFGDGFAPGLAQSQPKVWGSVYTPSTPAPAPATSPSSLVVGTTKRDATPRKRGTQLPEDWKPNDAHAQLAAERRVSLVDEVSKFKDWCASKGEARKDWDATFRNWLRNSKPTLTAAKPDVRSANEPIAQPPDGLTDEQMWEWHAEQRRRRA